MLRLNIIFSLILLGMLVSMIFSNSFNKQQTASKVGDFIRLILFMILVTTLWCANTSIETSKETTEQLKLEYPVLADAMRENELKEELNSILKAKQANNKRYIEIIEELNPNVE